MNVGQLTIEMAANVARLRKDMQEARSTVDRAMRDIRDTVSNAMGALGVSLGVGGLVAFVKSALNAADETAKLAQKIGVATEAVAGLQLAFRQSGVEAGALQTSMSRLATGISEGNDALRLMGINTKNADGSLKSARQVLGEVADKFKGYSDGAGKSALAVELFGKSGADLIPLLNGGAQALSEFDAEAAKLGLTIKDETAKQAEKFNDTLDLVGQGVRGVGSRIAADLLPMLTKLADEFYRTTTEGGRMKDLAGMLSGFLRVALETVVVLAANVAYVFRAIGIEIGGIAAQASAVARLDFAGAAAIGREMKTDADLARQSIDAFSASILGAGKNTDTAAVAMERTTSALQGAAPSLQDYRAKLEAAKKSSDEAKKAEQARADLALKIEGRTAALRAEVELGRELNDVEKLKLAQQKELAEFVAKYGEKHAGHIKMLHAEELAQAELRAQQREMLEGAQASLKMWEAEAEVRRKAAEAVDNQAVAFAETLSAIQLETEMLALSTTEREVAIAMRELEAKGLKKGTAAYEEYAAAIRNAIVDRHLVSASVEASKKIAEDWKRLTEQVGQSLSDALMKGGKSAWEYIKGTFRSTVLTMPIKAFVGGVTGGFGSAVSAATGSGGGGSSALSTASSMASLAGGLGAFGSYASTGAMSSLAGLGVFGAEAAVGTGLGASLGAAGTLLEGGSIMGGLGMGLGAVAPYLLAAYALYSLLSGGGETRGGSGFGYSAGGGGMSAGMQNLSVNPGQLLSAGQLAMLGGPSGGAIGGASGEATVRASISATVAGINTMFDRLGSTARIDEFWGKLETSSSGRGGVLSGGRLSTGAAFGESGLGNNYSGTLFESQTSFNLNGDEAIKAFALDLQQATVQALQAATDIPKVIRDQLAGVDAEALTGGQVASLLGTIDALMQVTEAAKALGIESDQVTTEMIRAAGGVEGFSAALSAYYDATRTDAERFEVLSTRTSEAFAALGRQMPATIEGYRDMVEGLDLSTEAGQAAYGALIQLAPAMQNFVAGLEKLRQNLEAATAAVTTAEGNFRSALQAVKDFVDNAAGAVITAEQNILGIRRAAMAEVESASQRLASADSAVASALQAIAGFVQQAQQQVTAAEGTIASIRQAAAQEYQSAAAAVAQAQAKIAETAVQAAARMRDLGKSIKDYLRDLGGTGEGSATGPQRLAFLRDSIRQAAAAAMGGDTEAAGRLTGLAADLLRASKDSASTFAAFAGDERMVRQLLGSVATMAESASAPGGAAAEDPQVTLAAAINRLARATSTAETVGASTAEVTRDLVGEYQAASRDLATATRELAKAAGFSSGANGGEAGFAQLVQNLSDARAEQAAAQSALTDATSTLEYVGGAIVDAAPDLRSAYDAATGALSTAQTAYADALAQTAAVNFSMLENQLTLADLLTDLRTASEALAAAIEKRDAAQAAVDGATPVQKSMSEMIDEIYVSVLGRHGEQAGLDYWSGLVSAGGTLDQVRGAIITIAEDLGWASMTLDEKVGWLMSSAGGTADHWKSLFVDGSHAGGLPVVPRDGYIAELHAGERVMTAADNAAFSSIDWSRFGRDDGAVQAMRAEIQQLRAELRAANGAIASNTGKTAKLLDKLDVDGVLTRT